MIARKKNVWGLREWSLFLSALLAALSLLTSIVGAIRNGGREVGRWVDHRAGHVVGDSLDVHRRTMHGRQR